MNLYLIGPRGCGKSSVGRLVAEALNRPWVDLDQRIQEAVGKSVAEIFASYGQGQFREFESNALLMLARETAGQPHVISLGGGAVLRPENRRVIETTGVTALLVAEPKVLVERMLADPATAAQRPALTDPADANWSLLEETEHVLALRMPTYQQCANLKLDTSLLSVAEVVQQVLRWLDRVDPSLMIRDQGVQV
jgi:shikimate kinase